MEIVYWLILILLIFISWKTKKNNDLILRIAFGLFIVSAILTVFGLRNISEPIMRVSLIFWLVGIVSATVEYRKNL